MVPRKFNIVDFGGFDLADQYGEVLPGIYDKIVDAHWNCVYIMCFGLKFAGFDIAPQYMTPEMFSDHIMLNGIISIDQNDVITISSMAPPPIEPVIIPLNTTENGIFAPPVGVDGYAPVTVNVSGLSGRDAPDASLGNDGDLYKRVMPIPDNVNFVEYLESSGTQYINTGIYATQDIDAIVTGDRRSGTSNSGCMLGVRTGSFSGMSRTLYFGSHSDNNGGVSVIKTGSSNSGSIANVSGVSTRRTKTIKDESGYYVYLSTIDESVAYSKLYRQTSNWQSDMPLCMFAFYSGTTLNINAGTRVIRVTILDKNVPIADYLPCLDGNGVACMWDNVAQEYVYNDGTDNFAYGSTVTPDALNPVYYVKENGVWKVIDGSQPR